MSDGGQTPLSASHQNNTNIVLAPFLSSSVCYQCHFISEVLTICKPHDVHSKTTLNYFVCLTHLSRPESKHALTQSLLSRQAKTVTRTQPWKAFWPLKAENFTAEQRAAMPWLTWKPDPQRPDEKPWRQWRLENQSCVTRRGASA